MLWSTHICRVDVFTSAHWTGPSPIEGECLVSFNYFCFIGIPVLNANSVNSDQTPRSAASDLLLHWLEMFNTWVINGAYALSTFRMLKYRISRKLELSDLKLVMESDFVVYHYQAVCGWSQLVVLTQCMIPMGLVVALTQCMSSWFLILLTQCTVFLVFMVPVVILTQCMLSWSLMWFENKAWLLTQLSLRDGGSSWD